MALTKRSCLSRSTRQPSTAREPLVRHLQRAGCVARNAAKTLRCTSSSHRSSGVASGPGAAASQGSVRNRGQRKLALLVIQFACCTLLTGCSSCLRAEVRVSWPLLPMVELVTFMIRNVGQDTWGPGGVEFRLSGVQGLGTLSAFRDSVAPGEEVTIPLTEFLGKSASSVAGVYVGRELRLTISFTDWRSNKECSATFVLKR